MKSNLEYFFEIFKLKNISVRIAIIVIFILVYITVTYNQNSGIFQKERQLSQNENLNNTILCVTKICLSEQCIEVPGKPQLSEIKIIGQFGDNQTKIIEIIPYNKICGD